MADEKLFDPFRAGNQRLIEILREGSEAWNRWRASNPDVPPDLGRADLFQRDLRGADLRFALLWAANLEKARLADADLSGAFLLGANFHSANLCTAHRARTSDCAECAHSSSGSSSINRNSASLTRNCGSEFSSGSLG